LILNACLQRTDVNKVISIVRKKSGQTHPKLFEIVHQNFLDFNSIQEDLQQVDLCFFCIGVYTGQVPREEFRRITVDITIAFAKTLKENSPNVVFSFLSGQGADQTEKSKVMFAKDKGAAENALISLQFKELAIFRPGYIYPVTARKEPNLFYSFTRLLYKPFLSKIYPNIGVSSTHLANSMVKIGFLGGNQVVYENSDIRDIAV
jgi:uncharacterized protein YbjT (DUF2867 family)